MRVFCWQSGVIYGEGERVRELRSLISGTSLVDKNNLRGIGYILRSSFDRRMDNGICSDYRTHERYCLFLLCYPTNGGTHTTLSGRHVMCSVFQLRCHGKYKPVMSVDILV